SAARSSNPGMRRHAIMEGTYVLHEHTFGCQARDPPLTVKPAGGFVCSADDGGASGGGTLGVAADDYDRTIRTFIPSYERMVATVVHWLDGPVPAAVLVGDLCPGAGARGARGGEGRAGRGGTGGAAGRPRRARRHRPKHARGRSDAVRGARRAFPSAARPLPGRASPLPRGRRLARPPPRCHARREARALSSDLPCAHPR